MRRAKHLFAPLLLAAVAAPAFAEGIKFTSEYDVGMQKAGKENKLVLAHFTQKGSQGCVQLTKTVFDPADGPAIAKKFIPLRVRAEDEKGREFFEKYGVNIVPTVMVLGPKGEELLRGVAPDAEKFNRLLETATDLQAGLDALGKTKKEAPAGMIAALRKIGAIEGGRAKTVLREHAENEDLPESVRRAALEGFVKQKENATDLVPFLGGKSQTLKLISFNALKTQGTSAMTALLDGLDSDNPETRVNCFTLAYVHTKNPKVTRDATFWRTAKTDVREPVVKAWKEWWEKKKPNDP